MNTTLETLPEGKRVVRTDVDLSAEIARTVEKLPGDRVRCRRVGVNTYRCNWIAPEASKGATGCAVIESYRIRESRFLRVVKVDGKLIIDDITIGRAA